MRRVFFVLMAALPALAVDGTVVNQTTGKPAANALVTLYRVGQQGMSPLETTKTDAGGRFTTKQSTQGPQLLQTIFDGVVYIRMLPPGSSTTGLAVEVFNSSKEPGDAQISQHMVLIEPGGGQVNATETYVFNNAGKVTFSNSSDGTLRFWLPEAAKNVVQVTALSPGSMPVQRDAEKTKQAGVYKLDFPIKPGETRIDVRYMVPRPDNGVFAGKVLYKGQGPTRLVAPPGVTLAGDGIQLMGPEPQTKANIYDVKTASYQVTVQGSGALAQQQSADPQDSGPQIEQIMPKLWDNVVPIVALAFGILALGFILLYRAQPETAEGKHEQRRRG